MKARLYSAMAKPSGPPKAAIFGGGGACHTRRATCLATFACLITGSAALDGTCQACLFTCLALTSSKLPGTDLPSKHTILPILGGWEERGTHPSAHVGLHPHTLATTFPPTPLCLYVPFVTTGRKTSLTSSHLPACCLAPGIPCSSPFTHTVGLPFLCGYTGSCLDTTFTIPFLPLLPAHHLCRSSAFPPRLHPFCTPHLGWFTFSMPYVLGSVGLVSVPWDYTQGRAFHAPLHTSGKPGGRWWQRAAGSARNRWKRGVGNADV